jgi:DNA-directed RNA polymerase specialized sigma24 family protein
MITEQEFKKAFAENYANIEEYTKKALNWSRSRLDYQALINDAYIYTWDNIAHLEAGSQVVSWMKTYIKNNIKWPNSEVQRRDRLSSRQNDIQTPTTSSSNMEMTTEQIEQLQIRFVASLTPYNRRLFHIWFVLGLRKGREIAQHLNMSISTGYIVIRNCKQLSEDYKNWLKQNIMI